ncbi:uncharacterized protein isoform X2 [Musca autumnalis]
MEQWQQLKDHHRNFANLFCNILTKRPTLIYPGFRHQNVPLYFKRLGFFRTVEKVEGERFDFGVTSLSYILFQY